MLIIQLFYFKIILEKITKYLNITKYKKNNLKI